ncbi:threonyl-tRNA synthetase [Dethiosulfatibacter aminovorans DSM 17477]|uniref:Threonine--tRNA ligase n=1 Tax=Dethiosulfatibacter aminovorans DSM 17477 TaxID=1121476 RepID=A0A1M6H300_9FIRM|nr:threonine--tRNA ligase [Dethiosulfatibacter aminovorans]SHJ16577.1 threonyl-tRNA synthetase [Dethiosulfatibacter aminovorans DSM 17477]
MIKITLPDGSIREFEEAVKVIDIAKNISEGLARVVVGAMVNGCPAGLDQLVEKDSEVSLLKFDDNEGKDIFRHTSSHILAQAVQRLYPGTMLAIGPAIENGFYYDFDSEHVFTEADFEKIEAEMKKIVKEDLKIERFELPRNEALAYVEERGEKYKVELINDLPEDAVISFYKQGEFVDLCAGPHLQSTKKVKSIKILSIAGAYWRGSEDNKMLQRIYATSFEKNKQLEEYLHRLEEAKKRDHRKLGKELDLFSMHEEGPGFPFFHPKGMVFRNLLEDLWRKEHVKKGYGEIKTPIILNEELWHRSGHYENYKENMYFTNIDEENYAVKPMNCPGGILVYKSNMYSYRDLPLRLGEMGLVHRHEMSGALHGLMRVRSFTQDDAHLFVTLSQLKDEIMGVVKFTDEMYKLFGFKYHVELSTKPEKAIGTDEEWDVAIESLREALVEMNVKYIVNEGDGAFYGPKIDFHLEDAIGRTWQCGTCQLDFQMPQRFDLSYVGQDGEKHRPVMLHRTIFGSIERFMGILIEHYAGAFPTWLAPVQVKILPISDKFNDYAEGVRKQLEEMDIRVELDTRSEKIGYKIREAQLQKIPYMFVVGEKEVEASEVSVRQRAEGDVGSKSVEEIAEEILAKIKNRDNDSPGLV